MPEHYRALCLWLLLGAVTYLAADEPGLDWPVQPSPLSRSQNADLQQAGEAYQQGAWQDVVQHIGEYLAGNPETRLSIDGLFLLGESCSQLGRYDDAAQAFRELLQQEPTEPLAAHTRFRLAEMAVFSARYADAEDLLNTFRARYPEHRLLEYVLPYLARTQAGLGQVDAARRSFAEALEKYPQGPLRQDCRLRIALLDYDQAAYQSSQRQLEQILQSADDQGPHTDAMYWLGMTELRLGDYEHAAARLLQVKDRPDAEELTDPSWYFAAEALRSAGQLEKAASTFQQLHQQRPQGKYYAHALLGELKCISTLRGDIEAARELHAALQGSGNRSLADDGTRLLTEIMLRQEQYAAALKLIQPLTADYRLDPTEDEREKYYENLYLAAEALRNLGQPVQAAERLGRVRLQLCSPGLRGRITLARLRSALAMGDATEAIRIGQTVEKQDREDSVDQALQAELVRAYLLTGQLRQAKMTFRPLQQLERAPASVLQAARELAEAAYQDGDLVNARRAYGTLLRWQQDDHDRAQAIVGLAWVDAKEGHDEDAVALLRDFLHEFPGHPSSGPVRLKLAELLIKIGNDDEAITALSSLETSSPETPEHAEALYRLALLLEAQSQPESWSQAVELTQRLLTEHAEYAHRDAVWYLRGILQTKLGSPEASQAFAQLIQQQPDSRYTTEALYRLAQLSAESGRPAEANRYLTKLTSAQRDDRVLPHALYLRAKLASESNDWNAARQALRQLIQDYPESPLTGPARYGIAESFFQQEQWEHAAKLFDALDEEPLRAQESWQAMVRLRRAQLLVRQDRFLDAMALASTMEREFPDFSLQYEADYVLGRAHAGRGEFTLARQYYARVVHADPHYGREITAIAQWMIGEAHFHQKNFEQAIQAFQRVSTDAKQPKWRALSLLQAGKCYERLEKPQQARTVFKRLLEDFESSPWTDEASDHLERLDQSPTKEVSEQS